MAFVRKKKIKRKYYRKGGFYHSRPVGDVEKSYDYYYLVENYRQDGKVKQRYLASLGYSPTVKDRIVDLQAWAKGLRESAARLAKRYGKYWGCMAEKEIEQAEWAEAQAEFLKQYL